MNVLSPQLLALSAFPAISSRACLMLPFRPQLVRGQPRHGQPRRLHLAPPFLLDDPYVPRYQTLTGADLARKRSAAHSHLTACNLCPRRCNVNRYEKVGVCLIGEKAKVNVIAPHFGEEPCVQGHNGSGSVFSSGCSLKCTFCQNHDISHVPNGRDLTPEELAEWYVKLQDVGNVHNINLVTPEHVVPQVALSIMAAKEMGLKVPVVYNTSSYDGMDSLKLMDGLVDIYLADFKTWTAATSKRLLKGEDYPETARESVLEMQRQVGDLCFTGDGIAKRGLLVRHLVMPGYVDEGEQIMRWLGEEVSRDVFVHVMEQYRPAANVGKPMRNPKQEDAEERKAVRQQGSYHTLGIEDGKKALYIVTIVVNEKPSVKETIVNIMGSTAGVHLPQLLHDSNVVKPPSRPSIQVPETLISRTRQFTGSPRGRSLALPTLRRWRRLSFKEQTSRWVGITMANVSNAILVVHQFILNMLGKACHDQKVRQKLWRSLVADLLDVYQRSLARAEFLLALKKIAAEDPRTAGRSEELNKDIDGWKRQSDPHYMSFLRRHHGTLQCYPSYRRPIIEGEKEWRITAAEPIGLKFRECTDHWLRVGSGKSSNAGNDYHTFEKFSGTGSEVPSKMKPPSAGLWSVVSFFLLIEKP
ncbi:putative Radical SAM superfamily protein [Zalerion maritima]|uniref:Radical SAM superfamily protein n=1 Tax=Zalerion maritima TaxID=339359 RepID=A0AAD5WND5_9PEZI|nr:putative Radical SAM superfamily protein [Zalerion maritima]